MLKASKDILQLPVHLLARILQCLDLHMRLQTGALVCSAWRKAAVLATDRVWLYSVPKQPSQQQLDGLSQWLAAHGSQAHISSIHIWSCRDRSESGPPPHLLLPCQQLTALKELHLKGLKVSAVDSSGSAASTLFCNSALAGLTSLQLSTPTTPDVERLTFSPRSTPGLCKLSSLQDLWLSYAAGCHVALLSCLTQLTRLHLQDTPLITTAGGPTLAALSALVQLQDMELATVLDDCELVRVQRADDYAGLTAPQRLTRLALLGFSGDSALEVQPVLFPAGRQLPQLLKVEMAPQLFLCSAYGMVSACPALQELVLCAPVRQERTDKGWASSLECLSALRALTKLDIDAGDVELGEYSWLAVAALTGLRELLVHCSAPEQLPVMSICGLLQFTALQRLQQLTSILWTRWDGAPDCGNLVLNCVLENEAPEGSPPDVWRRVPALACDVTAACLEELLNEDTQSAALEALRDAIQHAMQHSMQQQSLLQERVDALEAQLEVSEQQQLQESQQQLQRVRGLEQQLAASEQQLAASEQQKVQQQQRVHALEQQLAALQAKLAAVPGNMV